jgi:hypothetical protein
MAVPHPEESAVMEPGTATDRPAPHQLPPDIMSFCGRVSELAWLDDRLGEVGPGDTAVSVAVVSGMAGVGKMSLAP